MDEKKIGAFISECRKEKGLTQASLAEALGVTDKSVGNWENGRNMPDLSLFKPLCDILDISINELLSGEKIDKEKYEEKFEENIINTIDYSSRKINNSRKVIAIIIIVLGVLISITAMSIIASESSWGSVYSILGAIISLIGVSKLTHGLKYYKRLIICLIFFVSYIALLFIIDYISVITLKELPRFCSLKTGDDYVYACENLLYSVYRVNSNTPNEYIIVDTKKEYTLDTVPVVPFNRSKSGIDSIINYKSRYVGDNSNVGALINNLPLSEYGYVFEIDLVNLALTIDYHITSWYINENYYLEKSLLYNGISIFYLIDNVEIIKFNFSGKTYEINRSDVEKYYPNYNKINKDTFNLYLESKINDIEFVNLYFDKLFR